MRNSPGSPPILSAGEQKRIKTALIDLQLQTQNTSKKDIGTWNAARRAALNPENPRRQMLYSIYADTEIDLHLTGCIGQRKGATLQKSFKITDKTGKEKPELTEFFEAEWFKDFVSYSLDSRFFGYSLIQFGDIIKPAGGIMRFADTELIPREHVIPEFGRIVRNPADEWKTGVDYTSGAIADWCIGAGRPKDLGLLLKCAPQALSKKNMMAFWDKFGEIFGMPIRIGKTMSTDQNEVQSLTEMLVKMGAASWGLFPDGTDIEIKETTRGDAFEVYDRRIVRANLEISKGILNQTMTIDNGGSYSQANVHLDIFDAICAADADFVRDIINGRLLPLMVRHGFPLAGCRFLWDESIDYTPEQQIAIDRMVLENFEVEPSYIVEKYNIPVTGRKSHAAQMALSAQNDFFA